MICSALVRLQHVWMPMVLTPATTTLFQLDLTLCSFAKTIVWVTLCLWLHAALFFSASSVTAHRGRNRRGTQHTVQWWFSQLPTHGTIICWYSCIDIFCMISFVSSLALLPFPLPFTLLPLLLLHWVALWLPYLGEFPRSTFSPFLETTSWFCN